MTITRWAGTDRHRPEEKPPQNFTSNRKRLPAFARPLAEMRRQGVAPAGLTVTVRLDPWPPSDHPDCVAVPEVTVPPSMNVETLDASFTGGLDVQVAWWPSLTARERLDGLLRVILSANPRRLWWINIESPDGFNFVKSVERGVEVKL